MPLFRPIRVSASLALAVALLSSAGCDLIAPDTPDDGHLLAGLIEGMTDIQRRQHLVGDEEFARSFSPASGLGPIFVAQSCEQCHVGDGKGHPAFSLTRFGRPGPNGFDALPQLGGPQLQHRSIPGYPAERIPALATGISVFLPPAVSGLGYLEAVPDATLRSLADPEDTDGDGVSGRLQLHIPTPLIEAVLALDARSSSSPSARGTLVDGAYIGRFGKKGLTVNLLHQTVGAYQQDMGITSDLIPEDLFNVEAGNHVGDGAPDPEVSSATVAAVVFYLRTLRAPPRREADHPEVLEGAKLFAQIGCATCHVPTLRTGPSELAVLDRVDFHPYTDLLLHDMGPELDDGYTEGRALTSEWRTPPLWGLGIQERFQGGAAFYLHDGRARTLEEAIELHGGEGARSRSAFRALPAAARAQLLRFLRSL